VDQDQFDVFLSYNEKDLDAITYIAVQLHNYEIKPWLARWNLVRGKPWQKEVAKVLEKTNSCIVLLGPNGIGDWQEREISLAVDRQVKTKDEFRVIPVLLPGIRESKGDGDRGSLREQLKFIHENTWIEFQNSLDESEPLRQLVAGVKGLQPGPQLSLPIAHPVPKFQVCPYRGLEPFDTHHAPFFYGREKLVNKIIQNINDHLISDHQHRFLVAIGPSGSGKSSLLRAGVVHALSQRACDSSDHWPLLIFSPGSNPIKSLAISLEEYTNERISKVRLEEMEKNFLDRSDSLEFELRSTLDLRHSSATALLVIDQFEQIFTLCKDEEKREAFIANLLEATAPGASRIYVIIAMRVDFYSKCFKYKNFANTIASHLIPIQPMEQPDLVLAITEPAKKVQCGFEPGLVSRLLRDLEGSSVGLPLLEHTLLELWRYRENGLMSHKTYEEIGRISGALEQHAEKTYENFDEAEKTQCKRIFMRLTQPSEGGEYTKRQTLITELIPPHKGSEVTRESAIKVLQTLTSASVRLITTNGSMIAEGRGYAEVSHEALIRNWSRLRKWIEEDREGFRILHRLREATKEWLQQNKNRSFLYRGTRLTDTLKWAHDKKDHLSEDEKRFLSNSLYLRRAVIGGAAAAILLIISVAIVAIIQAIRERELKIEIQRKTDAARFQQVIQDLRKAWLNEESMLRWFDEAKLFVDPVNRYEAQLDELRQKSGAVADPQTRYSFRFNKLEDQERYDTIAELDKKLKEFDSAETGAIVQARQAFERHRSMHSTVEGANLEKWNRIIDQISDVTANPKYGGLRIKPQEGLVPLEKDPGSELFEFAHYMTGSILKRDENGRLILSGDTAVILVLLPSGQFDMGARKPRVVNGIAIEQSGQPNIDKDALNDEYPPTPIDLAPFFISKYEMTQGQWERTTYDNPSLFPLKGESQADKLMYPVEFISWDKAREGLIRVGLDLPTEAQWEYAARAGHYGVWGSVNDLSMVDKYGYISLPPDLRLQSTCIVGRFKANDFGLFDTIGNVWEWCLDQHCYYDKTQPSPETGLRECKDIARVFRGGSYYSDQLNARNTLRRSYPPEFYGPNVGVRPVRRLDQ
jgi:formylglycine-generating enzyme required for sulfatase activity